MTDRKPRTSSTPTITTNGGPRIKLYDNSRDRKTFNELADLYAIFKATEALEVAYTKDAITKDAYTDACSKLISQFKTAQHTLKETPHDNAAAFLEHYKASGDCKRAMRRLIEEGVPATIIHQDHSTKNGGGALVAADTAASFINVIDSLKLNIRTVDELTLSLLDLMACLNRTVGMPDDFAPKLKVHHWITIFQSMKANDEISEDQSRQLELDMNTSYSMYVSSLEKQ
jgi:ESCRT-I complex subunit VPS28|tara:strand:- start:3454 stop:4140 length:687 start_codon:yes stop_codon:yes gene_type:complete